MRNVNKLSVLLAIATTLMLGGCATSQKIQVVQAGDQNLNCAQIKEKLAEVDAVEADNDENKGVTGTNVAAALFFWPALAYTYMDAKDAKELATQRKSHLTTLYNEKNCS